MRTRGAHLGIHGIERSLQRQVRARRARPCRIDASAARAPRPGRRSAAARGAGIAAVDGTAHGRAAAGRAGPGRAAVHAAAGRSAAGQQNGLPRRRRDDRSDRKAEQRRDAYGSVLLWTGLAASRINEVIHLCRAKPAGHHERSCWPLIASYPSRGSPDLRGTPGGPFRASSRRARRTAMFVCDKARVAASTSRPAESRHRSARDRAVSSPTTTQESRMIDITRHNNNMMHDIFDVGSFGHGLAYRHRGWPGGRPTHSLQRQAAWVLDTIPESRMVLG
jgi:hypothetical protein